MSGDTREGEAFVRGERMDAAVIFAFEVAGKWGSFPESRVGFGKGGDGSEESAMLCLGPGTPEASQAIASFAVYSDGDREEVDDGLIQRRPAASFFVVQGSGELGGEISD